MAVCWPAGKCDENKNETSPESAAAPDTQHIARDVYYNIPSPQGVKRLSEVFGVGLKVDSISVRSAGVICNTATMMLYVCWHDTPPPREKGS